MSKTKDKVIDQHNAEQAATANAQQDAGQAKTTNALAALVAGDSSVTDKAAVVEGYMFNSTQTPPVVFIQGDKRAVCVAPTEAEASELCETVKRTLIAGNRTAAALGPYGTTATGKVWYDIITKLITQ